jgi:succinoglycan biosynthesis transport protein ExoP
MPPTDPNMHDNAKHLPGPRNGSGRRAPTTSPQITILDGPRVAAAPAAPAAAPNPLALLKALRRRWLPAVVAGLVLGALAAVATWYFPGLVRTGAYSLVRVNAKPPKLVYDVGDNEFDFEKYQKTQAALVRQRSVLEAALREPRVTELPDLPEPAQRAAWLERDLTVDFKDGPEVMRIMLPGSHPTELIEVVNAVTREYLRESARLEREERAVRLEKVTAAATKYEEELRVKRDALKKLTGGIVEDNDPTRLAVKQRLAAEQLGQTERDLLQARSELTHLQSEIDARRKQGTGPAPEPPAYLVDELVATRLEKDPFAIKQEARLAELQGEIGVILRVARDPEGQSAKPRREAEAVRTALEKYSQEVRAHAVKYLKDKARADSQAETGKLTERVAVLRQEERLLSERAKQLTDEAGGTKGGVDVQPLRDEIAKAEEVAKRVGEQAQALRIEQDAPPRVKELQDAVVLPRDDRKQAQMAGLAGAGVFGCVLFGFAWWEFRSRRVASPDEVAQGLGLRLLGALPRLPERVRQRLGGPAGKQDQHWHALLTESIDVTRTLLLHDAQAAALQVVLVTSAAEGEGKTSLASQLAASLARAGRKTLLLDCDLRKPAVHRLFDLPLEPGFSEVLRGEVHLNEVIRPTRLSRLWLIPAGICDSHATQALAQDNVQAVFEELRGQFEYVVLDSAPVLPVADSLLLAQYADGVIFAILRDESRMPRVQAAQQRLAALGVRVLGAVINGAPGDAYGSAYQGPVAAAAR